MSATSRRRFLSYVAVLPVAAACKSKSEGGAPGEAHSQGESSSRGDDESSIGPLLAPAALAARVADIESGKVAVYYVGPDELFAKHRVPGAKKLGPVSTDEGRAALVAALASLPPDGEAVVYCGCCPVRSCPNVRPASAVIRASGRKNARVLDLPTRFTTDWTDKGYPVGKS